MSLETGEVPTKWKNYWVNPIFTRATKILELQTTDQTVSRASRRSWWNTLYAPTSVFVHPLAIPTRLSFRLQLWDPTPSYFPRPGNHTRQKHSNGHWYFVLFQSFNVVPHQRLLNKLSHYGIDGSSHRWIKCFLSGRTEKVMVDGAPFVIGVPQGDVFGPLLFLLFVNNLSSTTSPGTLCRWLSRLPSHPQLTGPSHTSTWPWQSDPLVQAMEDAIQPCKMQGYEDYGGHQESSILPHGWTDAPKIQKATYLGVTLSRDLTWSENIQAVASKVTGCSSWTDRTSVDLPNAASPWTISHK